MYQYLFPVLMAGMILISGCASLSSFQTAKTLPVGEHQTHVAAGFLKGKVANYDISLPVLEAMYRQGLSEKLDFGVKYTFPVTLVGDIKYNLVGNDLPGKGTSVNPVAVAAGLGAGYLRVTSGDNTSNLIDVYVPVYFSFHTSESFATYLAPKYILRIMTGSSSGTSHLVAPTLGVMIGKKAGVALEGAYAIPLSSGTSGALQAGVSVFF